MLVHTQPVQLREKATQEGLGSPVSQSVRLGQGNPVTPLPTPTRSCRTIPAKWSHPQPAFWDRTQAAGMENTCMREEQHLILLLLRLWKDQKKRETSMEWEENTLQPE